LVLIARADIDDDQVASPANDRDVGLGFDQTGIQISGAPQDFVTLLRRSLGGDDIDRHRDIAIAHHGHSEVTLHKAVAVLGGGWL
jgi:hypothetical protein